jgi:hypothetical protein
MFNANKIGVLKQIIMRRVILICLVLWSFLEVKAQEEKDKNISFGIKGGANFSNIIKTGDGNFRTGYLTGYSAGLFMNIPIMGRLSFEPELLYATKGFKTAEEGMFMDRTFSQTTSWIEIPLLAKIWITPTFNLILGPQVSFLTKTTNKYEGTFAAIERTYYEEDADNLKNSVVGGTIGVGIDITDNLSIGGRYAIDLQKNNENGSSEIPEFRNQVWSVGLGLRF